jgi:hypothetical protein
MSETLVSQSHYSRGKTRDRKYIVTLGGQDVVEGEDKEESVRFVVLFQIFSNESQGISGHCVKAEQ